MAVLARHLLVPAASVPLDSIELPAALLGQFEQLHRMVLGVRPECLMTQRDDAGWIDVPPERQGFRIHKNLLTIKVEGGVLRLRVMPDKGEPFDASRLADYRARLVRLHGELLERNTQRSQN